MVCSNMRTPVTVTNTTSALVVTQYSGHVSLVVYLMNSPASASGNPLVWGKDVVHVLMLLMEDSPAQLSLSMTWTEALTTSTSSTLIPLTAGTSTHARMESSPWRTDARLELFSMPTPLSVTHQRMYLSVQITMKLLFNCGQMWSQVYWYVLVGSAYEVSYDVTTNWMSKYEIPTK